MTFSRLAFKICVIDDFFRQREQLFDAVGRQACERFEHTLSCNCTIILIFSFVCTPATNFCLLLVFLVTIVGDVVRARLVGLVVGVIRIATGLFVDTIKQLRQRSNFTVFARQCGLETGQLVVREALPDANAASVAPLLLRIALVPELNFFRRPNNFRFCHRISPAPHD